MRSRPKHPCPRECPDRKVGCRSACEAWQKYEKAYAEFMEEKKEQYERNFELTKFKSEMVEKSRKERRRRPCR